MAISVTYSAPNITVTGGTSGTPATMADIITADTAGGWGVATDFGLSNYQLDAYLTIGDGSTASYFRTDNETITWATGFCPKSAGYLVTSNAVFISGKIVEGLGVNGSVLNFWADAHIFTTGSWVGSVQLYGCRVNIRTGNRFYLYPPDPYIIVKDTVINFDVGTNDVFLPGSSMTRGVVASTDGGGVIEYYGDAALTGMVTNCGTLQSWLGGTSPNASDIVLTNTTTQVLREGAARTLSFIDVIMSPTNIIIDNASGIIYQKYTINIHVSDKDGANLATVAVLCEDTDGNTTGGFASVNTDANGDIAEQIIIYKGWTTTSETLKTYSPHKFTLSKAGYETLILENITIDAPIAWHLELQDPVVAGISAKIKHVGIGVSI